MNIDIIFSLLAISLCSMVIGYAIARIVGEALLAERGKDD